jgi:hypothetical protein
MNLSVVAVANEKCGSEQDEDEGQRGRRADERSVAYA